MSAALDEDKGGATQANVPVDPTPNREVATPSEQDWVSQILIAAITSLLTCSLVVLGYHQFVARAVPRNGVLSLAEVLETKQLQLAIMSSKPGITAAQRNQVTVEMGSFAHDLEREIAAIQKACGCVLLVREAVLRAAESGVVDYTDELRRKVGLEGVTKEQLMAQVKTLNQGIASFGGDPRSLPPSVAGGGKGADGGVE